MSRDLQTIEMQSGEKPEFCVIWLHGLGADGNDFVPIPPELGLPDSPPVRFVFPNAPLMPVTCNAGYVMPAWYDIVAIDGIHREVDEDGIVASCTAIRRLIARENERGIASERIVLAGFSQGGAIAYTAGLTHPERLAGIIALSAYIPAPRLLAESDTAANRETPIFIGHGSEDEVVPQALGDAARARLEGEGRPVSWHTYPMPHSVCQEEIDDIGAWLRLRLAA